MSVSVKKLNILLIGLFLIYLLGYFTTLSNTLIPMLCISQVFLIENIARSRSKILRLGTIIVTIASVIYFIASILIL